MAKGATLHLGCMVTRCVVSTSVRKKVTESAQAPLIRPQMKRKGNQFKHDGRD